MPIRTSVHPGRIVRQECPEPLGLSVTEAARALGVSAEMAIRLAKALGRAPEIWAGLQLAFDMAQACDAPTKLTCNA
jgi:antitoxin HigA-1